MSHHTPLAYAPCRVPLRTLVGPFNIRMTVHEGIAGDVWEADRRWRALGGPAFWLVRQGDTGSYNCRPSAAHSRACAIDFNWLSNGMTSKRNPCPGDMPAAFYRECWEPLGYGWGALWNSKCDRMHISKLLSEGGDGVLYRTWDNEPEDDMAQVSQAEWDKMKADVADIKKALYIGPPSGSGLPPTQLDDYVRERFQEVMEYLKEHLP
jgi:hypothetical protein